MSGVYHGCKPEKDNKKASTKGVRLAPHAKWPKKIMGLYILLADDSEVNFFVQIILLDIQTSKKIRYILVFKYDID